MTFQLSDGSTREFRIGTRISNPVHQWPDPNYRLNTSKRELRHDEIAEIRNLNRNHHGLEEGYLTEMVCYAIYNLFFYTFTCTNWCLCHYSITPIIS